jgi:ATP-binding cassette, subfamily B, bacterial CvaB/MchF/RaxB
MRFCRQAQAAECSLACLVMIASAHGSHFEIADLRRRFPSSLKGVTLSELISQASALQFNCRPLRLEVDELSQLALPCILHWGMSHFVVLKSVSRRNITILDPAVGERQLSYEEVSRHFTGVALELSPAPFFVPERKPPRVRLSQPLAACLGSGGRWL